MLNIAVCDDSRTDVEMLESAFDKLAQYQFSYEVYFTAKELLKHVIDDGEMYHLYIFCLLYTSGTGGRPLLYPCRFPCICKCTEEDRCLLHQQECVGKVCNFKYCAQW